MCDSFISHTCELRNKIHASGVELTHFSRSRQLFNKQLRGPISTDRFSLVGQSLQEQTLRTELLKCPILGTYTKWCPSKRIVISKSSIIARSARVVLNHLIIPFQSSWSLGFTGFKEQKYHHISVLSEKVFWSVDISGSEFVLIPCSNPKRMLITCFHFDPSLSIPDSRIGKRV